jgi:carbamoyl-phosphate synthase large subunit
MIKNGEMQFIINTPSGKQPRADEVVIRSMAVANRIPIMTTLRAAAASVSAIKSIAHSPLTVKSLQEHHSAA